MLPPLLQFVLDLYNGYKAIYSILYNSIKKITNISKIKL